MINQGNEVMDTVLNVLALMQKSGESKFHQDNANDYSQNNESENELADLLLKEWYGTATQVTSELTRYEVPVYKKRIRIRRKKTNV